MKYPANFLNFDFESTFSKRLESILIRTQKALNFISKSLSCKIEDLVAVPNHGYDHQNWLKDLWDTLHIRCVDMLSEGIISFESHGLIFEQFFHEFSAYFCE